MDINLLLSPQDSPATETPPPPHPAGSSHGGSPALHAYRSPSQRQARQAPSRTPSRAPHTPHSSHPHPHPQQQQYSQQQQQQQQQRSQAQAQAQAHQQQLHHQQQLQQHHSHQQQAQHAQQAQHQHAQHAQQHHHHQLQQQHQLHQQQQVQQQQAQQHYREQQVETAHAQAVQHAAYQRHVAKPQPSNPNKKPHPTPTPTSNSHPNTNTPPSTSSPYNHAAPPDSRATPPHPLSRQTSNPSLDVLSDLASMQQQQAQRQPNAPQRPVINLQAMRNNMSNESIPSPKTPRVFATSQLGPTSIEALNELEKAIIANPFDYYSRVNFVAILHQGLQSVVEAAEGHPGAAHTFELLDELLEAYASLDERFPLGERLWEYRINDAKALALNLEDRLAVMELCEKATREEPYSAKLWVINGSFVGYLIDCSWDPNSPEMWSNEEKTAGTQLFQFDHLKDIWRRGADFVKYDLAYSHLVWDPYLQLLLDDLDREFTPEKASNVASIFNERLSHPHATWNDTLSKFSNFTSKYNQQNYEETMERVVAQNEHIKATFALRNEFEFNLLKAVQAGDQNAEYYAMTRYLKWEKKTLGVSSFHLVNALFERATVRFPVDKTLWEDHFEFLVWQKDRANNLVDVLERATRHCPWSGSLWSSLILTLEEAGKSHKEIEHVKHSATRTGMLEHTDISELMEVQAAWCGYLRRKAFGDPTSTEDEADMAEIGIRSALELAHEVGVKKYGRDWKGHPRNRLERIHIKFETQRNNMDEARHIQEGLLKKQGDSYECWQRYYFFEMMAWRDEGDRRSPIPTKATALLERAMRQIATLDYPEQLIETYVNHCEQHEEVLKVRSANIERRRAEMVVAIRRAKERDVLEQEAAKHDHHVIADNTAKRKRDDDAAEETELLDAKKAKANDMDSSPAVAPSIETTAPPGSEEAPSVQKRNREHTTIIVRNLPIDTTQTRIRQFFTDAGEVHNINLKPEQDSTITATVEFKLPQEAEYSLLKAAKGFEGREITITRGEQTTLYVTNYPAHADEAYLRELFSPYGELLEIRFPSLQFDTHRRFCYIQFSSSKEATAAASHLNGKEVEGLKLSVAISDPNGKKKREGPTEDGREVYVRHLTYGLTRKEITNEFMKFGLIENINMPLQSGRYAGKNKGFCFVVYERKESAEKAVEGMNGKELAGFKIHVEIAKSKGDMKAKVKSEVLNSASQEREDDADAAATPAPADGETATTEQPVAAITAPAPQKPAPVKERSIALLGIPDTVNDARLAHLLAPFSYIKINYMPKHGGAIVQFANEADMGRAGLAFDNMEILPGRRIRVDTPDELKRQKAEFRPSTNLPAPRKDVVKPKASENSTESKTAATAPVLPFSMEGRVMPVMVKRPQPPQVGILRGRGRPGLGFVGPRSGPAPSKAASAKVEGGMKSNEKFREMFLGKGKDKKKEGEEKVEKVEKKDEVMKDVDMKDGGAGANGDGA